MEWVLCCSVLLEGMGRSLVLNLIPGAILIRNRKAYDGISNADYFLDAYPVDLKARCSEGLISEVYPVVLTVWTSGSRKGWPGSFPLLLMYNYWQLGGSLKR